MIVLELSERSEFLESSQILMKFKDFWYFFKTLNKLLEYMQEQFRNVS